LSGNSVGTSREQLGNTGSVQASFSKTKGSTKTSTTSTNNDGIVFMIDDGVFAGDGALH